MLRCHDILKNVGTEIVELDAEGNTEVLEEPEIESENKSSKLLPLAGLMMEQNRHQEEQQSSSSLSDLSMLATKSFQTSAAGIQTLASAQLFENGVKNYSNFATGDPYQNSKRMLVWTKEGKYIFVTYEGVKEERFSVQKVFTNAGKGTLDDPIVIEED